MILNGKVATVDRFFSFQEAIASKDGFIIDVGTNEEIKEHVSNKTNVIDAKGKTVLPGANDSHMHAVHTGFKLGPDCIDLGPPKVRSIQDVQASVARRIKEVPPGSWIYGMGWMGLHIRKEDLDAVAPENPVMLSDFSLHTLAVNSKALEIAGIDEGFRDLRPEEGIIGRDPRTGKLTGLFSEWGAQNLITKWGPRLSDRQLEDSITRVQRALNSHGITSHTDIVGVGGDNLILGSWGSGAIDAYERMRRQGKLTARVSCNVFPSVDGVQSYDSIMEGLKRTELPDFGDKNWVKADTLKIFCDQSFWAREDTPGKGSRGRSMFPGNTDEEQAEEITRTIVELHRRGW